MALAGRAPQGGALSAATNKDLRRRLGAVAGTKLNLSAVNVFGTPMVSAVHTRRVSLSSLDSRLKGVMAVAHEPVLIGNSGGAAAVMGAMPQAEDTQAEVTAFVETLLAHDRIDFGATRKKAKRGMGLVAAAGSPKHTTHVVRMVGGKKVLERTSFQCGMCSHR
jgi:hypothetical protein